MLDLLRKDFVNAWVLAKELDAVAAASDDAGVRTLCERIQENYDYPVDSVLLSSDLHVLGHVNVHEPGARSAAGYLGFLRKGLAAARGEVAPHAEPADGPAAKPEAKPSGNHGAAAQRAPREPLRLEPAAPTGSLLEVITKRPFGESSFAFFPIDATAFAAGGTIEIAVRMGGDAASGTFELCVAAGKGMRPERTLPKVAPNGTGELSLEFGKGARFGLAVKPGPGTAVGECNAFLATVTVRAR